MRFGKMALCVAACALTGQAAAHAQEAPPPAQPASPAPELTAPATQPAEPATQPAEPTTQPAEPTTQPADPTPAPATPAPAEETFTTITAPMGEAPPLPFPVVLSVGSYLTPRLGVGDFFIEPHLRVRLKAFWVQEDPNVFTVGRSNGFLLDQARVGVTGGFRRTVRFALSLEGASRRISAQNRLLGNLETTLRDAFFTFAPWDFLQFTFGQFIPPTDRETLSSLDAAQGSNRGGVATPQLLPELSPANRGIPAWEGLETPSLHSSRQLGMMMHGLINPLPFMGGSYALAITNGNGRGQLLNDNNDATVYGRVTAGVHRLPVLTLLNFGASLYYGRNTDISNLPDRITDQVLGGAFDAVVQIVGLQLWSEVLWRQTRHLTIQTPTELSLGGFVQVAYRDLFGFSPAFRLAYYQFSSALPQLNLVEATAGMRYDVPGLPITFQLSFTHPEETGWGVFDLGDANETRENIPAQARIPAPIRSTLGVPNWSLDQRDGFPIGNDRVEGVVQLSF